MCEVHISARVRRKKTREKNKRKKKKMSTPKYTRVWLVVVMIVCKRTAHSWSVLCPSFFPSTLPARRLYAYTPSHQLCAVIRIFFFYSHAFVHLFSLLSLSFSLSLSLPFYFSPFLSSLL